MNSIIKSYINEAFELSDMSDVDYTDTFADMDDEVGLIKE